MYKSTKIMKTFKLIRNRKQKYDEKEKFLIEQLITFEISHTDISQAIVNSIRRAIISEVEVIAVNPATINIEINTSSQHDQMIEKRITEIPLNLDPKSLKDLTFSIHSENDKDLPLENDEEYHLDVTTDHIKIYKNGKLIPSKKIFLESHLITQLKYKQQLKFDFNAELNNVKNGSKRFEEGSFVPKFLSIWQSGLASYRFKSLKNETIDDEKKYIGHENKEPKEFIFILQSFGSEYFDCHYIFAEAIRVLIKKLERTKIAVKNNGEPDYLKLIDKNNFYFIGEGYTLGNLITDGVINIQKSFGESLKNYCGDKPEHPLKDTFIIKILLDKKKIKLSENEVMIMAIDRQIKILNKFLKEWNEFEF